MSDELSTVADILGIINICLIAGGYLLYYYENSYKAQRNFKNRLFRSHVNFSLNWVSGPDKNLNLRTLIEAKADQIFSSGILIDKINEASKKTTTSDPFITLKTQEDQEYMLNSVLNVLSAEFNRGFLVQAFGDEESRGTAEKQFVIGVTYEQPRRKRVPPTIQKIRIMVASIDTLTQHFDPKNEPKPDDFTLASQWHDNRVWTLAKMGEHYFQELEAYQNGEKYIPRIYTMNLAVGQ